jgi:hypothetical protein
LAVSTSHGPDGAYLLPVNSAGLEFLGMPSWVSQVFSGIATDYCCRFSRGPFLAAQLA